MFRILRFVIITISDMTETAEYFPYLHLDDAFITGIVSMNIGVNHVLVPNYRHVSFVAILQKVFNLIADIILDNIDSFSHF